MVGGGTVGVSPAQPLYGCNDVVTLTATPDVDQAFAGWSGDFSSKSNPAILTVTGDHEMIATLGGRLRDDVEAVVHDWSRRLGAAFASGVGALGVPCSGMASGLPFATFVRSSSRRSSIGPFSRS